MSHNRSRWTHALDRNAPAHTSRRAFLGGLGAMVALPWLPSLRLGGAFAGEKAPVVRTLWVFLPNGVVKDRFFPTMGTKGLELSPILAPLENHKDDLLVMRGLTNEAGFDGRPGDHARGTATFLTCAPVEFEGVHLGQSIDQAIVEGRPEQLPYPSMQLGTEGGGTAGICDSGYPCAYPRNISWADETTPLPKLVSPRVVFERLFSGFDSAYSAVERERREVYRKSVLDTLVTDAQRLQARVNPQDRERLDQYLTGIRELELRLSAGDLYTCTPPGAPPSSTLSYQYVPAAMADLITIAFDCDLTRDISFMMGNGGSGRSHGFLGVPGNHHEISHHQNDPNKLDQLEIIQTWEIEQMAYLLDRLAERTSGTGRLLDDCAVVIGSEISDGNNHRHDDMPYVIAGNAGGAWETGRFLDFKNTRGVADLYLSVASAAGVPLNSFANSTGPLAL